MLVLVLATGLDALAPSTYCTDSLASGAYHIPHPHLHLDSERLAGSGVRYLAVLAQPERDLADRDHPRAVLGLDSPLGIRTSKLAPIDPSIPSFQILCPSLPLPAFQPFQPLSLRFCTPLHSHVVLLRASLTRDLAGGQQCITTPPLPGPAASGASSSPPWPRLELAPMSSHAYPALPTLPQEMHDMRERGAAPVAPTLYG